ncbi:flagellar biosynthesis protein FlhF [Rubrivivax rivuli]|uniref:Flagellar biosynthesis protein FlhF n=1 Tax=Rubrivivax rivuli TaxID=1862385 RepID=A0A437RHN4_9BURK|nr:flagellar biosynthesis protein FlhF [Rubrivivax rivuli]RVU46293.1 flagellar biosynthesis protein FlhF [Rubrivivax rivuli]
MNLKRFTARTSREALALVKQAFGDDAVVMSTKPCAEGVEVLAMAPESLQQLERVGQQAERVQAQPVQRAPAQPAAPASRLRDRVDPRMEPRLDARAEAVRAALQERRDERHEPSFDADVQQDVEQLQMSTLSFQDYVRQRMLKRREAELAAERAASAAAEPLRPAQLPPSVAPIEAARNRAARREAPAAAAPRELPVLRDEVPMHDTPHAALPSLGGIATPPLPAMPGVMARGEQIQLQAQAAAELATKATDRGDMMNELRSMRGLIEQRFGALAFMEKLQRQPRQAQLAQRLLDTGFSPALIRKLVESLPAEGDELAWASGVLERNLPTGEREPALEEAGGIYALIGATGVGKTTSTAKLAAAFATRHGAANLGLITLDAYRVGAHEQLRTYGRILGVPVHTAHDRASLEDLLDLLSAKKMVLIDTAGMAQRDSRTRELLDMLSHRAIQRLLVVNASAQGETIEDQLAAYAANNCRGIVLSKLDEAVKLGPALDSMIRHKLKVLAVANGQRVPEDWHRLSANALVQRALRSQAGAAWKLDDNDVNLIFAGLPASKAAAVAPLHV